MTTITKQLRTETAHRLMDYDGRCAHLHGHSYLWEVTAGNAVLTPNGMVADFKHLKAAMMEVLDPLDHALVLHRDDPLNRFFPAVLERGYDLELEEVLQGANGDTPRLHLFDRNPTAEYFAAWAFRGIQKAVDELCKDNEPFWFEIKSVKVWETATSFAEYKG